MSWQRRDASGTCGSSRVALIAATRISIFLEMDCVLRCGHWVHGTVVKCKTIIGRGEANDMNVCSCAGWRG